MQDTSTTRPEDRNASVAAGSRRYRYSPLTRYGRNLLRKVNRAVDEFKLIRNGDRVLAAVSGGKDSLSLLYLLQEHRRFYGIDFEIAAIHVVSDFNPRAEETREYLESVFRAADVPYAFQEISVTTDEQGNPADPTCFWCSWRRRQALFRYCADNGFTSLAMGHHAEDVAETTLLNLVYHGTLETMLPQRDFFDGTFRLIRPLFYVREKDLAYYARLAGFKTTTCVCPNDDTGKRKMMKGVLRDLRKQSKQLNSNLWRAARAWYDAFGDHPCHPNPRKAGDDDG